MSMTHHDRGSGLVPVTMKPSFIGFQGIRHYALPQGLTIQEMAVEIGDALPPAFWTGDGVVCVNDRRVPRDCWAYVRPRINPDREIVVTFHVVPRGQGRTAGILTTLAGVALTAAGIIFQQPWLISLGIGVTLSGVGMLLAPPPPQPKRGLESKTIQAGIAGNPPAPFEWLPRVLGRMVYSPPMLIRGYSVYRRGSITVGLAVGLAGRHAVSNIRINGALAASMANVTTEVKTGAPGDTALTIGNKWVWEEAANYRLSNFDLKTDSSQRDELFDQTTPANSYPQNQIFLTRSGEYADAAVIRLFFPQGMSADTEDNVAAAIPVRVLFRRRGSSTWISGPEFHFWDENKGKAELRQNITFRWQADTLGRLASPYVDRIGYVAYQRASTSGLSGFYEANAYFSNGSSRYAYHVGRDDDGYYVYLDPAVFPKDHYEFAIKRGLSYRTGLFTTATYAYQGDTTKGNFFGHYISGGVSKVRVDHEFKIRAEVQVEVFQTWRDEYPLQEALDGGVPLTLIGVEGRDIRIESVAAEFFSEMPVWNGADWNTIAATARPAAHYRHVLLDDLNDDPRDPEIVNIGVIEDWYDRCVDEGFECNAVASANEPEILAMIASAGWAGQRAHEQWEIIHERDTSGFNITQLFTPLNSSNYVASKAFEDLPHAFNVEFADEANDNSLKSVIVPAPGYADATATRYAALSLPGFTDENRAVARATNLIRQIYARQTVRQIDVGIEALVSQRGDVVGLAHDLRDAHVWFGRIREVYDNGVNVTGIVINGKALLSQASPPFGAAIRYRNGVIVLKPILASGDSDTLMFTTPFAIPAGAVLGKGCLVSVGVLDQEVRRCRISNIRYKDEFTATVSLVDEAPEIYTGVSAARGIAEGEGVVSGTGGLTATLAGAGAAVGAADAGAGGAFLGTYEAVGAAAGEGEAAGVGDSSGTVAGVGTSAGTGAAAGAGASTGIAQGDGTAPGTGAAAAAGATINTWGAGAAAGVGGAEGISPEGVPSSVFEAMPLLINTSNISAGAGNYTWTGKDIGDPHANRVIIMGVLGGDFGAAAHVLTVTPEDGPDAGIPIVADFVVSNGSSLANILVASIPTGTTATFDIEVTGASMSRAIIGYGVFYPESDAPIDSGTGAGSPLSNLAIESGGVAVVIGRVESASLIAQTGTWNGVDAVVEAAETQVETFNVWFGYIDCTETDATRDFTLTPASGTSRYVGASWGPPPA